MPNYSKIKTRRHAELDKRDYIYRLIDNSYVGGTQYTSKDYLFRYPKETKYSYECRKKRAVYFNYVAPLLDLLVGFLFGTDPERSKIESIKELIDNAGYGKSLDSLMRIVALYSLKYPTGILVDSPSFDQSQIQSEADRRDAGLNPYCLIYKPMQIRDFYYDEFNVLKWVLLDNSYVEKSDPIAEELAIKIYRLWKEKAWFDFYIVSQKDDANNFISEKYDIRINKKDEVVLIDEGNYNLLYIPFRFINWRDADSDFIGESFVEDIALINQSVFNTASYMDEMVAAGTFKMLTYQTETGEMPPELKSGGVGNLYAVPYAPGMNEPGFIGADLQNVQPFLDSLTYLVVQMLKKVGVDTDDEKAFIKSGIAKKLDFEKVKTLLTAGATEMENTEKWIFQTAGLWQGSKIDPEIKYTKDFMNDDIDDKLSRFAALSMAMLPYTETTKKIKKSMLQTGMSGELTQQEMNECIREIETTETEVPTMDLRAMSQEESQNNKKEMQADETK